MLELLDHLPTSMAQDPNGVDNKNDGDDDGDGDQNVPTFVPDALKPLTETFPNSWTVTRLKAWHKKIFPDPAIQTKLEGLNRKADIKAELLKLQEQENAKRKRMRVAGGYALPGDEQQGQQGGGGGDNNRDANNPPPQESEQQRLAREEADRKKKEDEKRLHEILTGLGTGKRNGQNDRPQVC